MSKTQSVYLTQRTMSALRPSDALSGRLNRIVDRYLEMIDADRREVCALFSAEELERLATAWSPSVGKLVLGQDVLSVLLSSLGDRALGKRVEELAFGELVVLVEVLEEEISKRTALVP